MTKTYYDVLGVAADASPAEIRKAYRRRARHTHPDAGGDAAAFHEVQAAYDTLVDPAARAAYDTALHAPESDQEPVSAGPPEPMSTAPVPAEEPRVPFASFARAYGARLAVLLLTTAAVTALAVLGQIDDAEYGDSYGSSSIFQALAPLPFVLYRAWVHYEPCVKAALPAWALLLITIGAVWRHPETSFAAGYVAISALMIVLGAALKSLARRRDRRADAREWAALRALADHPDRGLWWVEDVEPGANGAVTLVLSMPGRPGLAETTWANPGVLRPHWVVTTREGRVLAVARDGRRTTWEAGGW